MLYGYYVITGEARGKREPAGDEGGKRRRGRRGRPTSRAAAPDHALLLGLLARLEPGVERATAGTASIHLLASWLGRLLLVCSRVRALLWRRCTIIRFLLCASYSICLATTRASLIHLPGFWCSCWLGGVLVCWFVLLFYGFWLIFIFWGSWLKITACCSLILLACSLVRVLLCFAAPSSVSCYMYNIVCTYYIPIHVVIVC